MDLILLQLKLFAEKLAVESSAATPMHQPFIKMTSPISLVKSLMLQSFHKEKVRAREKVDEFWSQFRPRYKPKTRLCLRPILKKFKKVRDYGKHHDDDSATFHSNPRFQESFGFFRSELARKNETVFGLLDKPVEDSVKSPPFLDSDFKKGTARDLVSGLPISNLLEKEDELPSSLPRFEIVASKLLAKIGEDFLLCDHTFDIASFKLSFHEFTRDKGETNIQRLFHSKSSQVFIFEIHVSNVEFKKTKLPGSHALYLFDKMSNSGYILGIKLGYRMSIREKGGTNFLSSFESIDLLASCKDSGFCVVNNHSMGCYCKGIRDKGGGLLKDNSWRDHLRYLVSSLEKTFSAVSYFKGAMLLRLKCELANDCADDDDAKPVISKLRKAVRQELKMHDSFVMEWGLQGAEEAPINSVAVKYTNFLLATTSVKVEGVKGPGKIATPFERTKVALSHMLEFCKMYQRNLGQKNDQESAAATAALVNGKTTPKMMLHGNYTVN